MLATIHDDTWSVPNMQHMTPNSRRRDYSDIRGDGYKKIKDPSTWLKVATTLEKSPPPTHAQIILGTTVKKFKNSYRTTKIKSPSNKYDIDISAKIQCNFVMYSYDMSYLDVSCPQHLVNDIDCMSIKNILKWLPYVYAIQWWWDIQSVYAS